MSKNEQDTTSSFGGAVEKSRALNRSAFKEFMNDSEWRTAHWGNYVAIVEGELVGEGVNLDALIQEMSSQTNKPMLVVKVEEIDTMSMPFSAFPRFIGKAPA